LIDLSRQPWTGRFQVVVVWRFDRFARSVKHLVWALETFRSLNIGFVSLQEQLDTSTPIGQAMFTIIGAMAQLEHDIIRERVKAGLERAKARGIRLGRPRVSVAAHELMRLRAQGLSSGRLPAGFGVAARPCADTWPRRYPAPQLTRTLKPKRQARSKEGAVRGPRRSSRPAIDRLLPPDLESRPLVGDWLAFLAELLAAEAMKELVDRGDIG